MVLDPLAYRWSSYGSKVGRHPQDWLDDDPCYLALADSPEERAARYAAWLAETVPVDETEQICLALQWEQLTGSSRFIDEIAQKIKRRVEFRGPGRPRKLSCPTAPTVWLS